MKKAISKILEFCPGYLVLLLMLSFVSGIMTLLVTWVEANLINEVTDLMGSSFSWSYEFVFLLCGVFAIYIFRYLIPPFEKYIREECGMKLDKKFKVEIQNKIIQIDYELFEEPLFRDKWNRVMGKMDEKIQEFLEVVSDLFIVLVSLSGLLAYVASVSAKIMLFYLRVESLYH